MNRTLQELANELSEALNRLENGDLELDEVAPLTDKAREIYERLVALRYVAIEQMVRPNANKDGSFRLNDIHPNQTSLIDAIEEVSKLDSVKKAPEVIQESLFEPSFDKIEETADEVEDETEAHAAEVHLQFEAPEEDVNTEKKEAQTVEAPSVEPAPSATEEKEEEVGSKAKNEAVEAKKASKPKLHSAEKVQIKTTHQHQTADDSLAQKLRKTPIDDLRKAIGLNQKFLLINELFDGDADTYNASIDQLNGSSSFTAATTWIQSELRNRFDWDDESTTVQDFLDLVERRFL